MREWLTEKNKEQYDNEREKEQYDRDKEYEIEHLKENDKIDSMN